MKIEKGNKVKVHYVGTLNDGEEFDNSYKRGEPIEFTVGQGQMIKGFDNGVLDLEVGDKKTLNLSPEDAYGLVDERAHIPVERSNFPPDFKFEIGEMVQGRTQQGMPINAKILEISDNEVLLDMNHPLAGKSLNFDVEVMEIS
jgi:FKBP-type peptidyl-prolyl cis-trans isomerase 2